jgi:hypothetical protein
MPLFSLARLVLPSGRFLWLAVIYQNVCFFITRAAAQGNTLLFSWAPNQQDVTFPWDATG